MTDRIDGDVPGGDTIYQPTDTDSGPSTDHVGGTPATSAGTSTASISTTPEAGSHEIGATGGGTPPPLEPPGSTTDGSMGDLILLLTKLKAAESQSSIKEMVNSIHIHVNIQNAKRLDQAKQIIASHAAMAKAKKHGMFGKKWGWLGKVFTVVAAVAAAVLLPGIGVGLAALMIGGMIVNAVMSIPAVSKYLTDKLGAKGMMALTLGIAAVQLIGAIALAVMTGGAGGVAVAAEVEEIGAEGGEIALEAGQEAAEAGDEGAEVAEDTADAADGASDEGVGDGSEPEAESSQNVDQTGEEGVDDGYGDEGTGEVDESSTLEKLQTGAKWVRVGAQVSGDSVKGTEDVEDMYAAADQRDADRASDAADADGAKIRKQASMMEQDQELLQTLIQRLEETFSTCATTLKNEHATSMKIAQGISLTSNA